MSDREDLLRSLTDRSELTDLVARHSVWLDEARYDESDRLFTTDVVVRSPRGTATGLDGLVALARAGHDAYSRRMHSKSNLVVDVDGDTATVRAHDLAVFVIDDESEAIAAAVHRYGARRTESGWRFTSLDITPIALTAPLARVL
ncbi:nuclear transport factor 2 family protein [Rhodococcus rhodnii]|nr:nuclear transport factor 2 family protein [Rhodococcus rhodnii]TXG89497.1 nuclear transport factor 2 family protein [Rhodococcus rhodnii]